MGIDIHGLNFLRYAMKKSIGFKETVTIGRQGVMLPNAMAEEVLGSDDTYKGNVYCEDLLTRSFGASRVDSIDNSDYEKATLIHDMNDPLPQELYGKYDTVIDGGCLEHIFNVTQAFRNCSLLLKPGGQIIHILPANNYCGHGFWQMSPELFFSLYSTKNGYSDTEVFLANLEDVEKWYQVKKPENGLRVDVITETQVYAMVRTVLQRSDFSHTDVQQSDYKYEWENGAPPPQPQPVRKQKQLRQALLANPLTSILLRPIHEARVRARSTVKLNERNPGLTVVDVESLI